VDCGLLVVRAEVDMAVAGQLAAAAVTVLEERSGGPLVLDMSGLGFMGSTGIAKLIMIQDEAVAYGQRLQIVAGCNRQLRNVLATVGVDRRLPLCESIDEALADGCDAAEQMSGAAARRGQ